MAIKLTDIEDLQTEFDGLLAILTVSRQFGKTRSAVKLAGECNGVLLMATAEQARRVSREYGVTAAPVTNCNYTIRGKHTPVVLDQDAMVALLQMARKELARTRKIIKNAHRRLNTGHSKSCRVYRGNRSVDACNCGHKDLEDAIYNYKIGPPGDTL